MTSIAAITDNGGTHLNPGHVVTISLSLNEAVYVTGNPFLLLNDNEIATYTTGSGTNSLTFTYTVQPGDNTPDLQVTGLSLNGGTIQDGAGTALSGPVQGDLALQIDTTAPTVFDVVADFNSTGSQPALGDPFTYATETSLNVGFTLLPYYGNTNASSRRRPIHG